VATAERAVIERAPGGGRRPRARRHERWIKPLVFVLCLVPFSWLAWRALHDGLGADPIRESEIQTGLWTLRFLALALAVTPLRKITGWGALARYRRMMGLFVFFYACVHLSLWVGVDWFFDWPAMWEEIVKHKYILVGMATFLTLLPLALTSTKGWIRRLGGARWNRLHQLVYASAVLGTVHYLWAVKKDTFFPLVYFVVFALLLGYRLWGRYAPRPARPGADAATPSHTQRRPRSTTSARAARSTAPSLDADG
jgi:sulfoxide reductase heme-binding subunit YedZ